MTLHLRLILCLGLIGILTPIQAQVTTATITGVVIDNEKKPLVGATIQAIHEPTGTKYGTTSREGGLYTLPNLRVGGPYTVKASFIGYKDQSYEGIRLSLAQKRILDYQLIGQDLTTEEVEITADPNSVLNDQRTGAETNISNEQLRRLPTISRSASDYYRLNPASDGNSFAGRNDQYNNFSLDGSIFNNPFGLDAATPGGQTDAQPVSLDAIDQIQVSIAPYDVTASGFTGASVNAVTKSGTNQFKGTLFGFFRNQDLTGSKVRGTDLVVPDLQQTQAGFSLGGPLIKNRLFFFANLEIERREDLGSNFLASRSGLSGDNVSRVTAADLELVSSTLQSRFGYDTGPYEGYKHRTNNEKGLLKLDLNINEGNSLTITYNFLNAFKEKPAHPSAIGRRGPDLTTLQFANSGYRINNIIHSGIAELKSVFSNKASNKLQVGYTQFRDSRDPFSAPFPVVNIAKDGIRYIVAGHEPFSINNILNQDVFQITDNLNLYLGKHTLTLGTSFERFEFDNSFNLNAYGGTFNPDFASVGAFVDSVNAGVLDAVVEGARNTFDTRGEFDWSWAYVNVGQWSVYAQDEWDVSDQFKLTYGLRIDLPLYFNTSDSAARKAEIECCYDPDVTYFDEDGNPVQFDHSVLPKQTPYFNPRIGFNYDVSGDRSTQIRGGSGLFSGRFPFVWIGNHVGNPNFFFYNYTRTDFKFPQVWRTNLGYDQQFAGGWIASVDLVYTKDINGMMVRNYGIKPPSGQLSGVDNRPIYLSSDRTVPYANNAYVFTNTNVGYTFNATVQLQRNWSNGLYTSLAYNFLDAKDASSIEAEISSDAFDRNPALGHVNLAMLAPSLYGNRHRLVGVAYKKFDYSNGKMATTISVFAEAAKGGRFSYTYSGDINSDGSGLNDLIYIPTDAELGQMQFVSDDQRNAFGRFIENDAYLSERRGEYAEKYAILSPWYRKVDVRILQDFNFATAERTHTIQLSLDILNIGNLINSAWGVRQLPINTQPVGVSVDNGVPTYSFDTSLTETFADDISLLSRWQAQFGLRYIF